MSKQEKGGMRSAFHYIVEFAVILLGITVSVTIEKNNAHQYKESVKNQSLSRILTNIQTDSLDFEFNIAVHAPASASCAWITEQRSTFAEQHPDSIGKHCSMCLFADEVDDADVLFAGPDDADGAVAVVWGQQGLPVGWRVHEVLYALVGELHIAQVVIDRG